MQFIDQLRQIWSINQSLVCVGLDPDINRLPQFVLKSKQPILRFCKDIVDATNDLVCAFKPQIAYFAANKAETQLEELIAYIHDKYPKIPVILDAKRSDINSTAKMYAKEAFERYNADAVTVNPYLGSDSIEPFTSYKNKGVIVLCKTSNESASEIQNLRLDSGELFYEYIAKKAVADWNSNNNIALVVGATQLIELQIIRKIVGDMPLLIPGIGAQGGSLCQTLKLGLNKKRQGIIINSSRAVNYASNGADYAQAARNVVKNMNREIESHLNDL